MLVAYPFLPHYRRAVFVELDQLQTLSVEFAADAVGQEGIQPMRLDELKRVQSAPSRRIARVQWQPRVIALVSRTDASTVIFLGEAANLSYWIAAVIARMRGLRVYFWTIGWHRPERGPKRLVRLAFYRLAHGLLLYGTRAREIGVGAGYPSSRMHVIGNSMEPRFGGDTPPGLPDRVDGVAWVGAVIRLTPSKRLEMIFDAVAEIRSRGADVRVLIVGDGAAATALQSASERLSVPYVHLPGVYLRNELAAVYSVLDVTVVPSAVGLTAVQSMQFGVPVVSDDDADSQMPEWESIRAGQTGELYAAGSVISLVDAIERALARVRLDRAAVRETCIAEYSERWSPERQAKRIEEVILRSQASSE